MSYTEHLGIAFANIVYAFLSRIDLNDFEGSIRRMFEQDSQEKRNLIDFLMKKKGHRLSHFEEFSATKVSSSAAAATVSLSVPRVMRKSETPMFWDKYNNESPTSVNISEKSEIPSLGLLERNILTNEVVTQLTMVRNAFLDSFLKIYTDDHRRSSSFSFQPTSTSTTTNTSNSNNSNNNNNLLHRALQQIPLFYSGRSPDIRIKTVETVVFSLSEKLSGSYLKKSLPRSTIRPERLYTTQITEESDFYYVKIFSSVVEVVWSFSLCVILAPEHSILVRSGVSSHFCRFLLWDRARSSSLLGVKSSHPSLCEVPPVFFLSHNLATKLETHFHDVLLSVGSGDILPCSVYHLLLSSSCHELLSQIDVNSVKYIWRTLVQTCASVMKTARLSCRSWENIDWGDLIAKADPSASSIDKQSLAFSMKYIWRQRQRWWENAQDINNTSIVNDSWVNELPILLHGTFPNFLLSRFGGTAGLVISLCSSSKSTGVNKSEKMIGDSYNVMFRYIMHLCHIFYSCTGMKSILKELLDVVKKIVLLSKKDKKVRELVTLALSGCLLSIPGVYGSIFRYDIQNEVKNEKQQQQQEKNDDNKNIQENLLILLNEVSGWCKLKYAMPYSLSMSALLGMCSIDILSEKLISFFSTMESWIILADNSERIAILHSTLHCGGLLHDICKTYASSSLHRWDRSIEAFFSCVEKMIVKGIGCESWRETLHGTSLISAASDLLIFALQQEYFHQRGCHWLLKLLNTKAKVKILAKGGNAAVITCGQLIAIRTISSLCGLEYFSNNILIETKNSVEKESNLVGISAKENDKTFKTIYSIPFEQKISIKDRIVEFLSARGSYYSSRVVSIEGFSVHWRGLFLKNALYFVNTTDAIRISINELCKAALEYLRETSNEMYSEENIKYSLHLVNIFLVARFWVSPLEMLDKSLALPMVLVGPKTPLYEVVSRVILPYYILDKYEDNMWWSTLAIHRLAECIIVVLGNEEDDNVENLTSYLISHLTTLRDRMGCIINDELHSQRVEPNSFPLSSPSDVGEICEEEIRQQQQLQQQLQQQQKSRRNRWDWLLNVIDINSLSFVNELSLNLTSLEDWWAIPGLRGTALIDTLEGLAIILLGHSRQYIRQLGLTMLELVSSFLRLQKLHCENSVILENVNSPVDTSYSTPINNGISFTNPGDLNMFNNETYFPRFAMADIFKELGDHFIEMYTKQKERYVSFLHVFEGRNSSLRQSFDERSSTEGRSRNLRDSLNTTFSFNCHETRSINAVKNIQKEKRSSLTIRRVSEGYISLINSTFGECCMTEDNKLTPHFIFVSTTALALVMYGYGPGSAIVRVSSAIAGEIIERGFKFAMEQNSQTWKSCYTLNFILICVDNIKSSPDANRLTRGCERNRPGHQQGGNATFIGSIDTSSALGWQILNRNSEYFKLLDNITIPFIKHEISNDFITSYFFDMLQYLLVGPLEIASSESSSLVTFAGMMDSSHPIITHMREILIQSYSKTRRRKTNTVYPCLTILLPIIIIIARRYFVKPPVTPGRMQDTVATKRTKMEMIVHDLIDALLLGEPLDSEHGNKLEDERRLSTEALGHALKEGHGFSARSWLTLPFLPSINYHNDNKIIFNNNNNNNNNENFPELMPIIFIRGVLCDLIKLIYSKDSKYLEPQLKNKLLPKVLCSLTYQVQWFLKGYMNSPSSEFGEKLPKYMKSVMEKSILALQTVISSSEHSIGSRHQTEQTIIINSFAMFFFQWLQQSLPQECKNLEIISPKIFTLAVTLLVADSPSRETVRRVLNEVPIGGHVHRTFFSLIVTALSLTWSGQKEPLLAQKYYFKRELSNFRSDTSNDTFTTSIGTLWKVDNAIAELTKSESIIFYALAYLCEDATIGHIFDNTVRSKAESFLVLLCGESPNEITGDILDDWLCLILKLYRQGVGEKECVGGLFQSLFKMASDEVLSAGRKTSFPAKLQRIALKILSLLLRRVEATESNLRTVLNVTHACQNSSSEFVLAMLWGGWIAYEGKERERFVSLLVGSTIDLADKRIVTQYIDSYINHELTIQGKGHDGKLDGRSRGTYYSFLLFSLYQMKILRHSLAQSPPNSSVSAERGREPSFDPTKEDKIQQSLTNRLSRSFSRPESQQNRGNINSKGNSKRKVLWVLDENIWLGSLKLTKEKLMEHGYTGILNEFNEDSTSVREVSFVKPLVSVLFFASWAIQRLKQRDWRLWEELHRDLSTISTFVKHEFSSEIRCSSGNCPSYHSISIDDVTEETVQEDETRKTISQPYQSDSDSENSSTGDEQTTVNNVIKQQQQERNNNNNNEEEENDCDYAEQQSESSSDGTVVINTKIPETSFAEAIALNLKQAEKMKKEVKSINTKKTSDSSRFLHRDFLALLLHFACMLLVHLGCGEKCGGGERDELLSRFLAVESAFEALGSLLKGAASEGSYRAPNSFKNWMKLTFLRLENRETIGSINDESSISNNSSIFFGSGLNISSALIFEPSILFEEKNWDSKLSGSASSGVDNVLMELFLSISGHGRNMRGRRFLLRCLHESSTWLQRGGYTEIGIRNRMQIIYSYSSLLSMKVTRALSSCLSLTTGVLVVGCDWRQLWMEKTAMQLAEASAFRRLLNALSSCFILPINESSSSFYDLFLTKQDHILCTSILTSLGCLLRDIIIHEIYYSTGSFTKEVGERKPEVVILSTPFGDNSAFPTRYLLSCFWTGFAFLIAPKIWPAACQLLAVFHRYGCVKFLGNISKPSLTISNLLNMTVEPECLAIQIVLFRQGESLKLQHKIDNIHSSIESENKFRQITDVILNYLNEYCNEKGESALFIAFSELILLCEWNSFDLEKIAPQFSVISKNIVVDNSHKKQELTSIFSKDPLGLGSLPNRSFSYYLNCFADLWKQYLLVFSSECEGTSQNVSSRMRFMMDVFLNMAIKEFGVQSAEILLGRVKKGKSNHIDNLGTASSKSKSYNTDLCSLHSCIDPSGEKQRLGEESILAFQNYFESLIMLPVISLFQSSDTPLILWSKILSFVSALLWYHEQNHEFITDLLLKFLPDLEKGLNIGTMYDFFTDNTPLFDRLVVPVLADEVAAKLRSLKSLFSTISSSASSYDSRKGIPSLGAFLDNKNLIAKLIDSLAKDSFSTPPLAYTSQHTSGASYMEPPQTSAFPSNTKEENKSKVIPVLSSKNSLKNSICENNGIELQNCNVNKTSSVASDALDSSELTMECYSSKIPLQRSHLFGDFVYEIYPGINSNFPRQGQLPIEYYRTFVKDNLSNNTNSKNIGKSDEQEELSNSKNIRNSLSQRVIPFGNMTCLSMSSESDSSADSLSTLNDGEASENYSDSSTTFS